jgi:hypothetical protein
MRRRTAVCAALLALLGGAPLAPVASAAPKPPVVGSTTLVYGTGTASVDVTVPQGGVDLVERKPAKGVAPGFAIMVPGNGWAAVAVIARSTRYAGAPLNHVQVHLPAPDHCPSRVAPTIAPVPACTPYVEHVLHHAPDPRTNSTTNSWHLPAGVYQIVISAAPGQFVEAVLTFAKAPGARAVRARGRAAATLQRARIENVVAAHLDGEFGHRLGARGVAVTGLWHTTAGDEPGEFTYAECVVAGAAETANPDDCFARLAAGPGRVPAGKEPVWAQQSIGAVTLDPSGTGTFETPVLKAGTYTNSYRVSRGGRGPAVGTWVWWLEADSLR